MIASHETAMRERLDDVARIVDQLQQSMDLPGLQTPVHSRFEPDAHVLVATGLVDEADYAKFLGNAFDRLFAAVESSGAAIAGPDGARYPASVETDKEPVEAFIPITAPVTLSVDPITRQLLPDDQLRTEIAWPIIPNDQTNDPER